MFSALKHFASGVEHLLFPHVCHSCGTDVLSKKAILCSSCFQELPATNFEPVTGNMVESLFYGRLPIIEAASTYYYTKHSTIEGLCKSFKYRGRKDIAFYAGVLLGKALCQSNRFNTVEALIPLPLNPLKQQKRGFNQAEEICNGMVSEWPKPLITTAVTRNIFTDTQTHKNRVSRWQTMQNVFCISDALTLENKHILLVDDILTTGATLEACGSEILKVKGTRLSIATFAYTR